jgi:hypothetical protein
MKRWYELSIGGWSAMLGPQVTGRCWLICAENTVIFSGQSACELIAHVIGRCWRRISPSDQIAVDRQADDQSPKHGEPNPRALLAAEILVPKPTPFVDRMRPPRVLNPGESVRHPLTNAKQL